MSVPAVSAVSSATSLSRLMPLVGPCVLACAASLAQAQPQCSPRWIYGDGWPLNGGIEVLGLANENAQGPLANKVVVAGRFVSIGEVRARGLALYDLTTGAWSEMGSGLPGNWFQTGVKDIAALPDGSVVVVGTFVSAGGLQKRGFGRWDGTQWSDMGLPAQSTSVFAAHVTPAGELIIGGDLRLPSTGLIHIFRWDGSTWSPMGGALNEVPGWIGSLPSGETVVSGAFRFVDGVQTGPLIRWNGSAWESFGGLRSFSEVVATYFGPDGTLVRTSELAQAHRLFLWDGTTWVWMGDSDDAVATVLVKSAMEIYAGGEFTRIGNVPAQRFARWNGTGWEAIGTGVRDFPGTVAVCSLIDLPDDTVMLGGFFNIANEQRARSIARYGCTPCDSVDFNNNGIFPEDQDVVDFLRAFSGDACPTCVDLDFNNNFVSPEDADLLAFFRVLAGGTCD